MKKITTFLAIAFTLIGMSKAQMAIPGESFAQNPSRFNGRKVTVRNIQLDFSNKMPNGGAAPIPNSSNSTNSPQGPGGMGQGNPAFRCNPPRGFQMVDVDFLAAPAYQGCFYMKENMWAELRRQAGGQKIDAQITFQGDNRVGYNITFYQVGR